jgi:hypothetical protein
MFDSYAQGNQGMEYMALSSQDIWNGSSLCRYRSQSKDLLTVTAFDPEGEVEAFLSWTPLYAGNGWALDAMRRGNQTTPGTMELLIVALCPEEYTIS